jgi:tetratricopeptide (TPR) repeat protein
VIGALLALVWTGLAGNAEAQGVPTPPWATTQAAELTRQGKDHAARGNADVALRRLMQALQFDATYGPAYLALGELYERAGDPREGERVYSLGIDHVGRFAEGYLARARLRARQQRTPEAIADLTSAAELMPDDVTVLQRLVTAYVSLSAFPAALAVTRRIESLALDQRDEALASSTHVAARALARLVREVDPVTAGLTARGSLRRALALHADRR